VRKSAGGVGKSAHGVGKSAGAVRKSAQSVRKSAGGVGKSAGGVGKLAGGVGKLAGGVGKSAQSVRKSAGGVGKSAGGGRQRGGAGRKKLKMVLAGAGRVGRVAALEVVQLRLKLMLRRWDDPTNPPWDGGAFWDEEVVEAGNKRKRMKVKLALKSYSPDELVSLANAIKTAMTANAKFPTPNPTLVAMAALITALTNTINGYNSALDAADLALANRNAAVEALRTALTQWMSYVEMLAQTAADVESAGMQVRKAAAPVGPMPKVQNLKLTISDHAGAVDWMCEPPKGVSTYILQVNRVNPDTEAEWKYADASTKSSGTLKGLTAGKIWVRVAAKGADADPGPWSDPAEELVR